MVRVVAWCEAEDRGRAQLFVGNSEARIPRCVMDEETENMHDVFSVGVASIFWNCVVETLNVPFGFLPSQYIEVVAT